MEINKNTGDVITLDEAINFTHAYQEQNSEAIKSYFVGSDKVNMILNQENCIGLRIYNGYNTNENKTNLVLVGVDVNGEDLVSGVILENLLTCPKVCPKFSPLIKL